MVDPKSRDAKYSGWASRFTNRDQTLGTNGGGFYGQNSAHPFENPTPVSNFVEMLGLIIIAASLV